MYECKLHGCDNCMHACMCVCVFTCSTLRHRQTPVSGETKVPVFLLPLAEMPLAGWPGFRLVAGLI